jgi:hypothetical protein
MTKLDALVTDLHAGRERFLALVADVRPDLHRYCARMTGSVCDGEDIVQETLARAYYALSEVNVLPPLRSSPASGRWTTCADTTGEWTNHSISADGLRCRRGAPSAPSEKGRRRGPRPLSHPQPQQCSRRSPV